MCNATSSEKVREKTFLKHLQKRRKRKIPLLRGIYHNKMLKILLTLVCIVNVLNQVNIIQATVEAASSTNTTENVNTTELSVKSPSVANKSSSIRRSINVNSSFNHQNEIVQTKQPVNQTVKRKLRRKPLQGRLNHSRNSSASPSSPGLGPANRFKGKRRKYNRPIVQHKQQQNYTNIPYKPKNFTNIRTTASTLITASSTSSSSISTSRSSSSFTTASQQQQQQQHHQRPFITQQQQQFSYSNRSYQHQHQYQQQSVQIPSSTIRVSSTIDHHHHVAPTAYANSSSRFYPTTTNIKHYIGVNSTSLHDVPYQQQNVVIQGNTDIVVYRNIGPVPCPPGVRIVPHRTITAKPDPRINRQRGKKFLS